MGASPAKENKVSVLRGRPGSRTTSTRVVPCQLYPHPVSNRWVRSPTKLHQDRDHRKLREQEGCHVNVHYWHKSVTKEGLGFQMQKQEAECSHLCLAVGKSSRSLHSTEL